MGWVIEFTPYAQFCPTQFSLTSAGARPGQVVQMHHSTLRKVKLHHSILGDVLIQLFQKFI